MSDLFFTGLPGDSLSENTRKKRRNLLFASAAGIIIATMDTVPAKPGAVGIEFSPLVQSAFLILAAVVVAYFFLVFVAYGVTDFLFWRKNYKDYLVSLKRESQNGSYEDQLGYEERHQSIPRAEWLHNWYVPIVFLKLAFELLVPFIAGAFAVCMLLI